MRRALAGFVCVLGALLLGSNCEQTEILGPVSFAVEPDTGESTVALQLPFIGRTSLDWFIENNGGAIADFSILALSQQADEPNELRCARVGENPDVSYPLVRPSETPPGLDVRLPTVESNATLYDITLEEVSEGFEGWARLTGLAGSVEFVVRPSSVELQVLDANGNTLPAITSENSVCSETADDIGIRVYRLEEESYRLRLSAPVANLRLSAAETCISRENVDRTCPGTQGSLVERTTSLAPGDQVAGRFNTVDLGVGNAIAVTVLCTNDSSCQGLVEVAPYIEPLECRGDDDCSARRSCSPDGYCLRDSGGCRSIATGSLWSAAAWMLLLLLGAKTARTRLGETGASTNDQRDKKEDSESWSGDTKT